MSVNEKNTSNLSNSNEKSTYVVAPTDLAKADIAGEITKKIGSGKHAQASIVWHTIVWSFATGIGLTLLVVIWAYLVMEGNEKIVGDIKSIWSLFIPIITLALGYIFGKETK